MCSETSYDLRSNRHIAKVIGCTNRMKIDEATTATETEDASSFKNKEDIKPKVDDPVDEEGIYF